MLRDATFEAITGTPPLEPGEIHVWHVAWPRTMPPRAVSVATRGEVLCRLMAYAGLAAPPRIEPGAHGKPVVPDVPGIDFNISHSGTDVLVAFARQQPLGIDIESLDRDFSAVEKKALSEDEIDDIDEDKKHLQLAIYWCAKEALYKRMSIYGVDYAEQIEVRRFSPRPDRNDHDIHATFTFKDGTEMEFDLTYTVFENHVMAWVVG